MQNQTYKNEREFRNNTFTSKFCRDILLHFHEKSESRAEKDKKNMSIFPQVLVDNTSRSTASIST